MAKEISYKSVDQIVAEMPKGMTRCKIEIEDPNIGILTINQPESLNAFSSGLPVDKPRPTGWQLFDKYWRALLQEIKNDPEIRVLVVTGAGDRAFSSGANIKEWGGREAAQKEGKVEPPKFGTVIREGTAIPYLWFQHLGKISIAMVNGLAVGMGADMALACDLRVASDQAWLQWAYILRGMVPMDGGCWMLPRIVGRPKALELLVTGDRIYAEEALKWGLFNNVVPHGKLRETTMELATKIAKGPLAAVQLVRYTVFCGGYLPFQETLDMSMLAANLEAESIAEGMIAAGVEKRTADFTDK
jgi:2-(1,2-epoxy-1,2-dihydrophenyl)acetyl-CoA isomerase